MTRRTATTEGAPAPAALSSADGAGDGRPPGHPGYGAPGTVADRRLDGLQDEGPLLRTLTAMAVLLAVPFATLLSAPAAAADAPALYAQHCAGCHSADRLGGTGPALIPESLGPLRGPALAEVVAEGRPATQMPGFAATLGAVDVEALAAWLRTPPAEVPRWDAAQIAGSLAPAPGYRPAAAPVFEPETAPMMPTFL